MYQFFIAHQASILLAAGWLFSALMSSMPAYDPAKMPWAARWFLSFLQFVAANMHKV